MGSGSKPLDIAELRDKLATTLKLKERRLQEQQLELQGMAAELERWAGAAPLRTGRGLPWLQLLLSRARAFACCCPLLRQAQQGQQLRLGSIPAASAPFSCSPSRPLPLLAERCWSCSQHSHGSACSGPRLALLGAVRPSGRCNTHCGPARPPPPPGPFAPPLQDQG
jgi:hypothetical protein